MAAKTGFKWELGQKRRSVRNWPPSAAEVAAAKAQFVAKGGKVQKLPDLLVPMSEERLRGIVFRGYEEKT